MTIAFGSGRLFGVRTDVANSTPIEFGVLQDVNLDFSANTKELYGSFQFPMAVGRGHAKITGKAKLGKIQGALYADLFFGVSQATGQTALVAGETGSVPALTTYTVTVANSANFVEDLGVVYAVTGLPFVKVASAPAAGQYSVSAGVYTFAAADASAAVLLSYTYTVAASGKKLIITNQLLGSQPVFSIYLKTQYTAPGGAQYGYLKLNACVASKLTLPTKQEDFTITEFDFAAFADASNVVGYYCNNVGD